MEKGKILERLIKEQGYSIRGFAKKSPQIYSISKMNNMFA